MDIFGYRSGYRCGGRARCCFAKLWSDQRGATSIEYALIAILISITVLGGATLIGSKLNGTFSQVASNLGT